MKEFICICCPRGCHLVVDDNYKVSGNFCPRGAAYGAQEAKAPQRIVTSTVKLVSKDLARLPVKTSTSIPKEKIFDVMAEINKITAKTPIFVGDIVIKNVCNLNVDIISTKEVKE